MDKFTKIQKQEAQMTGKSSENAYDGTNLNVITYKERDVVKAPDHVAVLPFFKDDGVFLLKHKYVPAYQLRYKENKKYSQITNFLTAITGEMQGDDKPNTAVRRVLYSEGGIAINASYPLVDRDPLFVDTDSVTWCYPYLVELRYNDYKQALKPTEDGQSRLVKISLGDLFELKVHDVLTAYMLMLLRTEYNLKP